MTQPDRLLRVQDKQGRGPWRPGFSMEWTDAWRTSLPAPLFEDFPQFEKIVADAQKRELHIGCATRGESGIFTWFSVPELLRLHDWGFHIVHCDGCDVLAESETQALIASPRPLKRLPRTMLQKVAA